MGRGRRPWPVLVLVFCRKEVRLEYRVPTQSGQTFVHGAVLSPFLSLETLCFSKESFPPICVSSEVGETLAASGVGHSWCLTASCSQQSWLVRSQRSMATRGSLCFLHPPLRRPSPEGLVLLPGPALRFWDLCFPLRREGSSLVRGGVSSSGWT